MIEQVIDFLINQPTATTSPVYTAVNTPAMLTELGSGVTAVAIYDTHLVTPVTPYVKLQQAPNVQNLSTFLAGGHQRIWTESYDLIFECAAHGSTANEAANRANYMAMALGGKLQSLTYTSLNRADINGGSSYDKVVRWMVNTQPIDNPADGPGTTTSPLWLKKTMVKLTVWIAKARGA